MKIIISPAKNLDFKTPAPYDIRTEIRYCDQAKELIAELKKYSSDEIEKLMGVSSKIAALNKERYAQWHYPFSSINSKQAIYAFNGEVYHGINAMTFNEPEIEFAQNKLRILSGLYGILKPMDSILPYRLEMGTKLPNLKGQTLYSFWGDTLQHAMEEELHADDGVLINLASTEYSKVLNLKEINATIVTPVFKDFRNGQLKQIMMYAKKARGMMARYIIQNQLTNVEDVKSFSDAGYLFDENLSNDKEWVFTR